MNVTPPRIRYHIILPSGEQMALEAENVIAWTAGFGAALGNTSALNVIPAHAPEDTRRVQALQIADGQNWFRYLYPETYTSEG